MDVLLSSLPLSSCNSRLLLLTAFLFVLAVRLFTIPDLLLSREIKLPKLYPRGARGCQVENLRDGHLLSLSSLRRQTRAGYLALSFYQQSKRALGPTRLRFRYLALACVIFLGTALPAHRLLSISSPEAGLILLKFHFGAQHVKSHLDDPWLYLVIDRIKAFLFTTVIIS